MSNPSLRTIPPPSPPRRFPRTAEPAQAFAQAGMRSPRAWKFAFGALLSLLLLTLSPTTHAAPVGGGILDGGLLGEYFANPDFTGSPAFTRHDVRVDFDWGTHARPGGSHAAGFRELSPDAFSVRWSGRFSPRVSETFTLRVDADDGARLSLKGPDETAFRTLIDAPSTPGTHEATVSLEAGAVYDLRLEYRELTGPAQVRLRWRSPGTPEEPLEAVTLAALNVDSYADELWANAMDGARDEWRDPGFTNDTTRWPPRDPLGWPLADAAIIVWEGAESSSVTGTYRLTFPGRARVAAQGSAATFLIQGVPIGHELPAGEGWDPASNVTTADVAIAPVDILYLYFTETRRLPGDSTPTGVHQIQLLRPRAADGTTPHAEGERFDERARDAFSRYQALRWISNFETERTWSDRTLPAYSTHRDIGTRRHWELMVQLANETGKDLYACIPHRADDDYVRRLARLLRFGSDGVNPYDAPQANPVHPPLNPNLRVYLERGNELWNWSFHQAPESASDGQDEVRNGTPNGAILNFDGRNASGDQFYRWHALRSLQMSEVFRAVWGDNAMGPRIRFLLEYQYDNFQDTAESALDFLDRYFNNADGAHHVATPRPVNHFFWGGGGATYFSSGNAQGTQTHTPLENGDFESPALPPGTAPTAPPGTGWTFHGTAGLFQRSDPSDAIVPASLGPVTTTLPGRRSLGFTFTVGAQPLGLYELGRVAPNGLGRYHELRIVRAADRQTVAWGELLPGARPAGGIASTRLTIPVTLEPATTYHLVCTEDPDGDPFHDATTRIDVASGIGLTLDGAVSATPGSPDWDTSTWTFSSAGPPGTAFGPLILRATPTRLGALGFPPDPPSGRQALWLAGTGSVSRVVHFPRPGTYALRFLSATPEGRETGVFFHLDDENITPRGESHRGTSDDHWLPGFGFNRNSRQFENNGSFVFTITNPGPRTLRIAATGFPRYYNPFDVRIDPDLQIWFDRLEIVGTDAIFDGGIPGFGEANGQPAEIAGSHEAAIRSQARYAQAYGLQVVAYEGGWSLGGDFGAVPIQNYAKFRDPRAARAALDSMDIFARSGGSLYTWGTYTTWPHGDTANSGDFPLTRGVDTHASRLPPPPRNGLHIPNRLIAANARWRLGASLEGGYAVLDQPGAWIGWNVITPDTATYEAVLTTVGVLSSPDTARVALQLNGADLAPLIDAGTTVTQLVTLTRGLHNLRVQSRAGIPAIIELDLRRAGTPGAPRLLAVEDGNGAATLRWAPADTGPAPTGYLIRHGTQPGVYNAEVETGAGTTFTLGDLPNHSTHYFEVIARNGNGFGPPSAEGATTPFPDGDIASLAVFEFTGLAGNEPAAPPRVVSSRATASPIGRGTGLLPSTYPTVALNTFGSVATDDTYAQDLPDSIRRRQYYEFTIQPNPPRTLALSELRFRPYFQNVTGLDTDPRGAGLAWSTNGTDFIPLSVPGTPSYYGTSEFQIDLSDQPGLRSLPGPVWFRIHLFGNGPYEFTGIGGPGDDIVVRGSLHAPGSPAVPPPTLAVSRTTATLTLAFPAATGRPYTLFRSANLVDWDPVATLTAGGNAEAFTQPLTALPGGTFFRVSTPSP